MELDVEKRKRIDRIGNLLLSSLVISLAVILAYFVLLPIAIVASYRFEILHDGGDYPILEIVGAPIEWLSENFELYKELLDSLVKLILA